MSKRTLECLGRCDNMGDIDLSGDHVKIIYRSGPNGEIGHHGTEHHIEISETNAKILAMELDFALKSHSPRKPRYQLRKLWG